MLAASLRRSQILSILLHKPGIDVNAHSGSNKSTALTLAASSGDEQVVRQLLAHVEIDVNKRDGWSSSYVLSKLVSSLKFIICAYVSSLSKDTKSLCFNLRSRTPNYGFGNIKLSVSSVQIDHSYKIRCLFRSRDAIRFLCGPRDTGRPTQRERYSTKPGHRLRTGCNSAPSATKRSQSQGSRCIQSDHCPRTQNVLS